MTARAAAAPEKEAQTMAGDPGHDCRSARVTPSSIMSVGLRAVWRRIVAVRSRDCQDRMMTAYTERWRYDGACQLLQAWVHGMPLRSRWAGKAGMFDATKPHPSENHSAPPPV